MILPKYPTLRWGQTWYVKHDEEQCPRVLIGLLNTPGRQTQYLLADADGNEAFYYDSLCTKEPTNDLGLDPKDEQDDDEEP